MREEAMKEKIEEIQVLVESTNEEGDYDSEQNAQKSLDHARHTCMSSCSMASGGHEYHCIDGSSTTFCAPSPLLLSSASTPPAISTLRRIFQLIGSLCNPARLKVHAHST